MVNELAIRTGMTWGTRHIELNLVVVPSAQVLPIAMATLNLSFTRAPVSDTHTKHQIFHIVIAIAMFDFRLAPQTFFLNP